MARFGLDWTLRPAERQRKVLILVSMFDHCLIDLLYRRRIGELPMDVAGSSRTIRGRRWRASELADSPITTCRSTRDTKSAQEAEVRRVIEETGAELVVLRATCRCCRTNSGLARGGASTSTTASCRGSRGRSPTPGARAGGEDDRGDGALRDRRPRRGADHRQDVEHVSHADTPDDLVGKGRDIERRVLARRWPGTCRTGCC